MEIPINWAGTDDPNYYNGFEPNESIIGNPVTGEGYSSLSLGRLRSIVNLVQQNGLHVWFNSQPIKQGTVADAHNWAQQYGNSFITFNEQPSGTPMPGRDRYKNFIKYICNQFPGVSIDPWFFPYHKDAARLPNPTIERAYYDVCQHTLS